MNRLAYWFSCLPVYLFILDGNNQFNLGQERDAGIDDFEVKPWNRAKLISLLEEVDDEN